MDLIQFITKTFTLDSATTLIITIVGIYIFLQFKKILNDDLNKYRLEISKELENQNKKIEEIKQSYNYITNNLDKLEFLVNNFQSVQEIFSIYKNTYTGEYYKMIQKFFYFVQEKLHDIFVKFENGEKYKYFKIQIQDYENKILATLNKWLFLDNETKIKHGDFFTKYLKVKVLIIAETLFNFYDENKQTYNENDIKFLFSYFITVLRTILEEYLLLSQSKSFDEIMQLLDKRFSDIDDLLNKIVNDATKNSSDNIIEMLKKSL